MVSVIFLMIHTMKLYKKIIIEKSYEFYRFFFNLYFFRPYETLTFELFLMLNYNKKLTNIHFFEYSLVNFIKTCNFKI